MKNLLILLSILLLSSPVIGDNHKVVTRYLWETSSGDGYIWKGFGDKKTHQKYTGEWKNGKPNGFGIMTYTNGFPIIESNVSTKPNEMGGYGYIERGFVTKYVGEWKDGKWNGRGTLNYGSVKEYRGEFKDWEYTNGIIIKTGGSLKKIVGKIVNGIGTEFYDMKLLPKYVGSYKKGEPWNGKYYDSGGKIYKFVNGKQIDQ